MSRRSYAQPVAQTEAAFLAQNTFGSGKREQFAQLASGLMVKLKYVYSFGTAEIGSAFAYQHVFISGVRHIDGCPFQTVHRTLISVHSKFLLFFCSIIAQLLRN